MISEKELKLNTPLFDDKGLLMQAGRSFAGLPAFSSAILPFWTRSIKYIGVDKYFFGNDTLRLVVSAAEARLFAVVSVSLYTKSEEGFRERTARKLIPMSFGSLEMPDSPGYGDIIYRSDGFSLDLCKSPSARYIRCKIDNFDDVRSLYVNIELVESGNTSLYYVSDIGQKDCFRIARKQLCMRAKGKVLCGAEDYELSPERGFGCLDWERGVFPRSCSYIGLWGDGMSEGETLGFSFGAGLSGGAADENYISFGGECFTPGDAELTADERDFLRPWHIKSVDKRCELVFSPRSLHRREAAFLFTPKIERIFAFGEYSGSLRLSNGRTLTLEEFPGFGELISSGDKTIVERHKK